MRHGSRIDPPNRFESRRREADLEQVAGDDDYLAALSDRPIEYLTDATRSVVTHNQSPDIGFRYSLNPYRGCIHGCAYCYARNTHEYLGFSAGLDFETRIVVKRDAPQLFREFLAREAWQPELIVFSGVTDCYQPAEREFRLTRQCLEVALEFGQPVSIVTKNALVLRDLDILAQLAARRLVHVAVSITTLDGELARTMEPRTSIPPARLRTVRTLADAGIPVRVMMAPIIPGLNDAEMPAVLEAARDSGARAASYILLRLPLTVEPVFREWLRTMQPLKAQRIEGLIRGTREGKWNSSQWGRRMSGSGPIAGQIRDLFRMLSRRFGLDGDLPPLDFGQFQRPPPRAGQLWLF
jgi:DNA repair photolyase